MILELTLESIGQVRLEEVLRERPDPFYCKTDIHLFNLEGSKDKFYLSPKRRTVSNKNKGRIMIYKDKK